jgi:hypothetical protein
LPLQRSCLTKEYHAILAVQVVNSFDTSDESELLMKKLFNSIIVLIHTNRMEMFLSFFLYII